MFVRGLPPMMIVPPGFHIDEADLAEWGRPGGIIEMCPNKGGSQQIILHSEQGR